MTDSELMRLANEARKNAYAPYSGFAVGAALLLQNGEVITGCNVENASFGATICAERVAISAAAARGETRFRALAVCGGKKGQSTKPLFMPCGICRQVMQEFCGKDFRVLLEGENGICSYHLDELLPFGFSSHLLAKKEETEITLPEGFDRILQIEDVKKALGNRPRDSHKGMFGYVGILCGSLRYSGAAKLANLGAAAMRSGCGVVTLGVPETLAPVMAPYLLESTLFPIPERDGTMVYNEAALENFLAGKRAVAVGMGWGRSDDYQSILEFLFKNFSGALLLDADALNTIAAVGLDKMPSTRATVILTPHPMEFSRLCRKSVEEILERPVDLAREYAAAHGVTVLLKGAATVVTDGKVVYGVDRGCAGMATAGSGDVLSGILAGMLGYLPANAMTVACGAFLAGLAGEIAERDSNAVSMVASDTIAAIPRAFSEILKNK